MEDDKIMDLYWRREERAIEETEQKYGGYLLKIAYNILSNLEDSRECVNDTYLKAWKSIPPNRPVSLAAYLGRITRQGAIDVFRARNRNKRQASEYAVSLTELEECISGSDTPEQRLDLYLLASSINAYLYTLSKEARVTFVGRYYYGDSVKEIASYCSMSESKAKSMLYRTRQGLKTYLRQEGFDL